MAPRGVGADEVGANRTTTRLPRWPCNERAKYYFADLSMTIDAMP